MIEQDQAQTAQTPTIAEMAERLLRQSGDEIGLEERRVLDNIASGGVTARDPVDIAAATATFGDRLSDRVAAIGGSWSFIIGFSAVLLGWMLLNSDVLQRFGLAFDPYPYIFLNLVLSTLAAVQAPIIMMSQNRQAAADRLDARLDYETNLRAELDILRLHAKLDEITTGQLAGIERRLAALADSLERAQGIRVERSGPPF